MSIQILSYKDRPDLPDLLCTLAQRERKRVQQIRNFDPTHVGKAWTLKYMLEDHRFSQPGSDYLFALDGQEVVCAAGCYAHNDFKHHGKPVSVVMSRMYTVPNRRVQWIGTKILERLVHIVETPYCLVSFNEENKGLYLSLTSRNCGLVWPPVWRSFEPLGKLCFNYVDQWCAVAETEILRKAAK